MPDWLAQTTGMSQGSAQLLAVVLALLIIAVLIAVCIPLLKRFARTSYKGSRSRQPRLAIMDAADIDARRRLLLVRRDNVEHLIMIGGANDIIVEQGIIRGMPVAVPTHGQMFTGNGQVGTTQATPEQTPPSEEPTAHLNWGEAESFAAAEIKTAISNRNDTKKQPEVKAPIRPAMTAPAQTPAAKATITEKVAAVPQAAPASRTTPAAHMTPARLIRPAASVSATAQAGRPAALQTPTIGGARGVQKVEARPIAARSLSPSQAKPALKQAEPIASVPERVLEKPAPGPEAPGTEAPAASRQLPKSAMKPPLKRPAANAANAFMRPRVTETLAKVQKEKNAIPKPEATTEKSVVKAEKSVPKPEDTKASSKTSDRKSAKREKAPEAARPVKQEEKAEKPEVSKAAPKKAESTTPRESPGEALDGIAKEMADLLDDIETNTK